MLRMRIRLLFALVGCALLAVFLAGCSGPWVPFGRPIDVAKASTNVDGQQSAKVESAMEPRADRSLGDIGSVADKLQAVRDIDPAAEQKLLEKLRETPSKSWPLVAEQFRASLAYRQNMEMKKQPLATQRIGSADHDALKSGSESQFGVTANEAAPVLETRPSAPIGALVDPRSADADGVSSEAMAMATPYSSPSAAPPTNRATVAREVSTAPDEFIADNAIHPIAAAPPAASKEAESVKATKLDSPVMQTRFESPTKVETSPATAVSSPAKNVDWQEHVRLAADDLSHRVAADPATTAEVHQHASLRMLWLLAGDTEKALEPIPHVSPTEQDYWSRQLFTLATYLDHHSQPDDKRRAAASVTHLDEAIANLRELGALTLRNLTFCKNIYGYGSIDPFATDTFSPGQQVSLYVEVENYHSKPTEKGYCTLLGSTYEILDDQGKRVSGGEFPDVDDCCRSRRRDFHIQYGLTLPDDMAAGTYQLQLVVKDRQSEKIGNTAASFEIRGKLLSPPPLPAATMTK